MSIDIFIDYNGSRSPFGIQPRCRLARFYEVVSQGLNIEITKVVHNRHGVQQQLLTPEQKSLYLIEDLHIKPGDIIVVCGTILGKMQVSDTVIHLKYKDIALMAVQLTPHSNVKHIIDLVRQSNLFVPDTVKLSFKDMDLNQWNKVLISDLEVKNGDVLDVQGTFCPLPKGYEHMSNLGIHIEEKCVVCLEALPAHKYSCGHMNVCQPCYATGSVHRCPVCNI